MNTIIKCVICGATTETTEVEGDWLEWEPSFYDGERDMGPCCPVCSAKHLEQGADGEWQLNPQRN